MQIYAFIQKGKMLTEKKGKNIDKITGDGKKTQ